MPSSIRTRYTNAARHVADQMGATVNILETASDQPGTHPDVRYAYRAVALELRRLRLEVLGDITPRNGDIGEEQEEVEVVPLHNPAEVPSQPVPA
jgi:hypothetical protein